LIIDIRGERVLLDSDVARIYGVDTKRINEAVKNNPEKFPVDYIVRLSGEELQDFRPQNSHDNDLRISDSETSIELNFAVLKFKHTIKRKK